MSKYRTGRLAAAWLTGTGWVLAAIFALVVVYRLVRFDPATWATTMPLLIGIAFGLLCVVAGHAARALFDMADRPD